MLRMKSFGVNFVYGQLRLRAGHARQLRRDPAGGRRRGDARRASRSRTSASTTGRPPTPTGRTATRATPSSTCARRRTIPPSSSMPMSHNATGYDGGDTNPDMIDGIQETRGSSMVRGTAPQPGRCARRRSSSGSTRRASSITTTAGNLGEMYTLNFYLNFAPIQETRRLVRALGHRGVKPVFLAEYAAPVSWDFGMYRGWYNGKRAFGSARGPLGVVPGAVELAVLRRRRPSGSASWRRRTCAGRAKQFRAGAGWHHWDYPDQLGHRSTRRSTRSWRCTSPTTGARSAPGGCRRSTSGSASNYWKLRHGR